MQTARQPFHIIAKPIGPICNLACEYCFYLDKEDLYPKAQNFMMSEEVLEQFIYRYIQTQPQGTRDIQFSWQGGEPTLRGLDFFKKAVALQKQYLKPGMQYSNTLQTHGGQLNKSWGEFLKAEQFLVGLSIDGPEDLHNAYRRTKSDQGSFESTMKGLDILNQFEIEYNALTVIHQKNQDHGRAVYSFLKEQGISFIQFIPLVGSDPSQDVSPVAFGQFLIDVFEEWSKEDIGQIHIQGFENTIGQCLGLPSTICVHAKTCGRALAIEHNGDLYSCDHFVQPQNLLGNFCSEDPAALIESSLQKQFGDYKFDSIHAQCHSCSYYNYCHGGCPKDWANSSSSKAGLNHLCQGYFNFYQHTLPHFNAMAYAYQNQFPIEKYKNFLTQ